MERNECRTAYRAPGRDGCGQHAGATGGVEAACGVFGGAVERGAGDAALAGGVQRDAANVVCGGSRENGLDCGAFRSEAQFAAGDVLFSGCVEFKADGVVIGDGTERADADMETWICDDVALNESRGEKTRWRSEVHHGDCGENRAAVSVAKRTIDELESLACENIVADQPRKRRREFAVSAPTPMDEDDLLQVLDLAFELENQPNDGDGVTADGSASGYCPRDDLDVPALAQMTMVTVKRNIHEQKPDTQLEDKEADKKPDESDILQHLDAAYERANAGRPDTCYASDRSKTVGEDLDVKSVAAFGLSLTKYRHALAAERAAYRRSRPGQCGEEKDDVEQYLVHHVLDAMNAGKAYKQSCYRERNPDHNRGRRERDRERYRERKAAACRDHNQFGPITDTDRAEALRRLQLALGPDGLEESVCVACDELVPRRDATRKDISDWRFLNQMRRCLGEVDKTLPQSLVDAYAAPACATYLSNVMVAPNSFHCYMDDDGNPTAWFTICNACYKSIQRGGMPKFAIANGFYVGKLPEKLTGLTLPERFMTQLVSISAMTRVMRGGRHRCIRSHCVAFDCTPGPPVSLLPTSISEVDGFRVALVGDFTEAQLQKVKALHRVRTSKLRDVYDFYVRNNSLYSGIMRNNSVLGGDIEYDLFEHRVLEHIKDENGVADSNVREELENIRGHSDVWLVDGEDDEVSVVERRIALSDTTKELLSGVSTAQGRNKQEKGTRTFLVKRSNQISPDGSGDLFAKMFPHLFPYGRGHPGEARQIPVSLAGCVKHYTLLSRRQFAEDELFTLIAFDRLSMTNMYTQNSIRCQRFPSIYNDFELIGSPELEKALLENEQRIQGRRSARSVQDSVAHRFLKTVEVASSAVWGSNAERSKCRQKAFAYQLRFGQPSLFITLTPNTDNSLAMAHYAGISSVDSLFDILNARIPTKAELREASLGNDCTSTRLFMRSVDAFIENALGMDPATQEPMPFRGLLGGVEAYFGMVETQGRGTLHIHLLVWLKGVPSSSVELEAKLKGPDGREFQQLVEAYIQSIVSNNLPLPVEKFCCVRCGAPYSDLIGLSIPPHTRQNPRRGIYSSKLHAAVVEPALVQCGRCQTKSSSQHVLRSVLLQSRPMHWPPWTRELTAAEIDHQASKEGAIRNSFKQAVAIVNEREKTQMLVRNACNALREVHGLRTTRDKECLVAANALQMSACSSEDDPFQNDSLARRIEALPPMLSDERMGRDWMNYMVSSLVISLNLHWWNHTSSCFKTSRATVNDSFCRYLFPRDRSSHTTFDEAGAHLERKLAHEFVNGFNYEIMAAYKCNHDIQVLLGGRDAAERIHYCTKYVTKQQKQLDSVAMMALASFQRRQERENLAEKDSQKQSTQFIAKARKRVASMVYTMTSRQEIAGPLASLYIYRGSCCYESSKCSFVPLHDIIRQLCSTEEYSCALVEESGDSGASKFQAVSFLDDYIFRPAKLENLNIYEFAMMYFRKRDAHALSATLPFKASHPLSKSHSLGKRYKEVVPVIQGFRLPFVTDTSPKAIQYKRAVLSLILFKAFRTLSDLIESDADCEDQWLASYTQWEATRSELIVKIMHHIDDYYCGADSAKSRAHEVTDGAVSSSTAVREFDNSDESEEEDNDLLFDGYDCDDVEDDAVTVSNDFINPWDPERDADTIVDTADLNPAECPTSGKPDKRVAAILQVFKTHNMMEASALHTVRRQLPVTVPSQFPAIHDMRRWVQDSDTDNRLHEEAGSEGTVVRVSEVLELLDEALEDGAMSWWKSASGLPSQATKCSTKFASISQISREYTLNEKQHYAFKLIGKALLTRWQKVEDLSYANSGSHFAFQQDQLRFFLGGEGGTGKSRVLDAVHALCASWNRADCLIKTALTGKAATLISGRTLASFLLQLRKKRKSAALYLDILVIDEVSMMKKYQLAQLDNLLRRVKRVPTVPFGGIHIVLVGDFLQLPPVGGEPLYRNPSPRRQQNAKEIAGYALWLTFERVVMLDESVRFQADPEWGRGCKYARKGVWLPEFVDLINSRVADSSHALDCDQRQELPSFITPDNSTRLSINNLFISTAASVMQEGEYPVRVVADFKGHLTKLGEAEVAMVMSLPDTKFGRMAPYLDLIVGMPVQLTQNIRATKMAANGTLGTLEKIIYQPGTTFCRAYDRIGNFTVKIPSLPPTALIVRIHRGSSAVAMPGCVDPELFPLFSDARPYSECNIQLAKSRTGMPRSLSVRIEQFPLVCAISSTVYKVQGETLNNMVVTEWRSENRIANKREQPYLLVSRVTSRNAFRTLCPLTEEITKWARPSKETLDEEERLQQLSTTTLDRLTRDN